MNWEDFEGIGWVGIAISLVALGISALTFYRSRRAHIGAHWRRADQGGMRFLVLKNTGPGSARITEVKIWNEVGSAPVEFTYAADRDLFPVELGPGASFNFQLDKNQPHPDNVMVEWKEGRWKHCKRVPVSSMISDR